MRSTTRGLLALIATAVLVAVAAGPAQAFTTCGGCGSPPTVTDAGPYLTFSAARHISVRLAHKIDRGATVGQCARRSRSRVNCDIQWRRGYCRCHLVSHVVKTRTRIRAATRDSEYRCDRVF